MASSDAKPFPIKNTAYRVTFPILDADGDLVTGAANLDSEVSKDGGTFADCTNETTEIATSSGMYYLDLSSDEMNADTVAIIIKTSTSGAKTTPIVLYPAESTDIPVNVTAIGGVAQSATDLKDFADDGYDPATNKVQGVVLADTVTTLTGNTAQTGDSFARLGAPAGASVSADVAAVKGYVDDIGVAGAGLTALPWNAAWDAEVQSECTDALNAYDPPTKAELDTAHATTNGYIDTEVAAVLAAVDTEVAAIKAKTDNLPAAPADDTSIDSQLAAIAGYLDTEIAAIKAKTDNLPAAPADDTSIDTQLGALQTDVTAIKGYVDTEVAAVLAAVDTEVAAIKAKTDNLPAAPADDTSIDSQLAAIAGYLDTEIAAIKVVTDKVSTALELDGAVYRYTANALEQAPSGGATVGQIADAVWDEAAADHVAAGSTGKKLNDVTGGSPVNIEHDSTVIVTDS